ncbi:hypothetical protein FACS1894169_06250 [Bacteroidia bacterium]|nr:hypothetical protein FACS1894169_06250 [Bacteroidia bacterium]
MSIFLSVDQLVEQTGTPYQYCYQNPVKLIDPTGMAPEDGDGDGNERILPRTEPLKHGGSWYRNVGVFAHNALASFTNVVYDVGESLIQESIFIYNNGVGAYLSNFGNSISNSVSSTYNYIVDTPVKEILKNEWSALKRDIADPYAWSDAIGKTAWMLTPMKATGGTRALVPTIETPSMMIGPPASNIGVNYTKSNLRLGQQMHKSYKVGLHDGVNGIKEYRLPSGKRIDFLDIPNQTIFELKPFNPRAMKQGQIQLNMYLKELQTIQEYKGFNWKTTLDTY